MVYTFASLFFQLFNNGQHRYVVGSRPEQLCGGRIPAQRDVRQHEVFQERLERSPVLVAQEYKRQMEAMGCSSIRDFARRTGRDHSVVARHLRILKLPDEVLAFLEENQTPEILRAYHVKRLARLAGNDSTTTGRGIRAIRPARAPTGRQSSVRARQVVLHPGASDATATATGRADRADEADVAD